MLYTLNKKIIQQRYLNVLLAEVAQESFSR